MKSVSVIQQPTLGADINMAVDKIPPSVSLSLTESLMKTILITGANRGLGLAHVRSFASRGIRVFATARFPDDAIELKQLATLHAGLVDVLAYDAADLQAPSLLKAIVGDTPLDLVFCNAGVMGESGQSFGQIDVLGILEIVRINSLAPLKLVEALADNVACSKRKLVAFQSSLMGSVGDNGSGGQYGYRISKCALNMVAKSVANDLRARGVISVALHPGWVKTRMGGQNAPLTIEQSVAGQQQIFDRLSSNDSGRFFNYDGKELPW